VKAVYGEGFDARTYLQRFFDAVYALPSATGPQQLRIWMKERPIFADGRCCWAIPGRGFKEDAFGVGASGVLAWIFQGMKLELRAQNQVLELMEAAALGLPEKRHIHMPWLALVCALWHSQRPAFDELERSARRNGNGDDVWNRLSLDATRRKYVTFSHLPPAAQDVEVSLKDMGAAYSSRAARDLVEMRSRHNGEARSFSNLIEEEILKDAPNPYSSAEAYPCGLVDYFELARTAGHLRLD
jgi:hypothetical protein